MGMSKDHATRKVHAAAKAPGATHQRILRVLGLTQRPLESGEIEKALGLVDSEARTACRWLTEHGYISRTAMACWSLASKGRAWTRAQSALVAQGLQSLSHGATV